MSTEPRGQGEEPLKPSRFIDSVNCAIEGVLFATRTQKHMRWHLFSAAALLVASLLLRVPLQEFVVLLLAAAFVLFAELMNTAVEAVVDLVTPDFHPLAKRAKDLAAGGVLAAAVAAGVAGYFILSRHLFPLYRRGLEMIGFAGEAGTVVAVLLVVVAVVVWKARGGTGSPLHGGMPSGHAAVAFSIATAVTLNTRDPLVSVMTIALAVMVSHSRLLMRIHTIREVVAGGALGVAVTGGILFLFMLFNH